MRIIRKRKISGFSSGTLPLTVRGVRVGVFGEVSGGIAACRTGASSVTFVSENSVDRAELEEVVRCFKNASVSDHLTEAVDVVLLGRPIGNAAFAFVRRAKHVVVTSERVALEALLNEGFAIEQQEPGKPVVLVRPEEERAKRRRGALAPGTSAYVEAVATGLGAMDLEEVD